MATEILKEQRIALDNLTPYQGRWIALRDGHVIADGDDPLALRHQVLQSDDLFYVPINDADTLIL
jgi:hypothetical protein